jgi:hypothetical protein
VPHSRPHLQTPPPPHLFFSFFAAARVDKISDVFLALRSE